MNIQSLKMKLAERTCDVRFRLIQWLSPSIWNRSQNVVEPDHWNLFHNQVPRASTLYAESFFKGRTVSCAELGVALADNAASILSLLNVQHLYLIDPYDTFLINYKWKPKIMPLQLQQKRLLIAQRKLKRWTSKCTWLNMPSRKAVVRIPDNSLDFIYIDGDHSYQGFFEDLALYFQKMRKNSIIAGHDFTGDWLEPVRAVLDFSKEHNLELLTRQADWWMVKN